MPAPSKRMRTVQEAVEGSFRLFGILIEQVGFLGALLIATLWFINRNATQDQKRRIIEMYVLGQGISLVWPVVAVFVGCVVVVFAQHYIHQKKEQVLQTRINELAEEKTHLQEEAVGRKLRHAADSAKEVAKQSGAAAPPKSRPRRSK
jgi:hypothetical protein